eukprot:jgi/Ulvmu1/6873/UM031_0078.1
MSRGCPSGVWMSVMFGLTLVGQVLSSGCTNLLDQSFTPRRKQAQYSKAMAQQDFPNTQRPYKMIVGGDQGSPRTTVQDSMIKGSYPKGAISGKETGFTWYSVLPQQLEEASMSYRVKFSSGFEWTKGGKLPGLCGGDGRAACPVGCSSVSRDRAWSTRLMWREGGRMVTYAYYPDKPKSIRCGEDWVWSKKVQSNKWHHVRMWVKLNTPGKKDGEYKAWLDGKQVLHRTGIPYRYKSEFKISRAYITTYCGGSSRSLFAPKTDQSIWFDDFKVWSGDCSEPSQSTPHSLPLQAPAQIAPSTPQPATTSGAGHGDNHGAQSLAVDYRLYKSEAGWDIPGYGDLETVTPPSGLTMREEIVQCARYCDRRNGCKIFTFYQNRCYLKRDVGRSPTYKGQTTKGWRWLFIEEA